MRGAALEQEGSRQLLPQRVAPDGGESGEEPEGAIGSSVAGDTATWACGRDAGYAAAPAAARLAIGVAVLATCGAVAVFARSMSPDSGHRLGALSRAGGAAQLLAKWESGSGLCAASGEDCTGTLCCEEDGQECYQKDDFYAGCRSECTPGHADNWACTRAKRSCACRGSCMADVGCRAFPEVVFIYLPEVKEDDARWQELRQEYDDHVPCGHDTIRKMVGVNPDLWPTGKGRYDDVELWAEDLQDMDVGSSIWVGYDEIHIQEDTPWYYKKRLIYAEVNGRRESTWALKGFKHHTGCTLTHFITWMDARNRSLDHIIVSESDGTMKQWWTPYSKGAPDEYSSVVQALLEELPGDWDVVFLDKGTNGVSPNAQPVKQLTRECWSSPYDLYAWTGEGVAGAALYMVSSRFLDQLPKLIHDTGLDMVDAWLGSRCNPNLGGEIPGGQLKCYSVEGSRTASACERICIFGGQAASCWKRIWSKAQEGGDPESDCFDANEHVHKQCALCADCHLESRDCSGDGTLRLSEGDQGQEETAVEAHDTAGCDQECLFEGQSATCGARMQFAMQQSEGLPDASGEPCEEAFELVCGQCEECSKCRLGECLGIAKAGSVAEGRNSAGCDEDCIFEGQSATCGARMEFAMDQGQGPPHACEEAFKLVRSQCAVCGRCQLGVCPDIQPVPDEESSSAKDADDEPSSAKPSAAKDADDEQEQAVADSDEKTEASKSSCDADCVWDGITATCGDRITYSAAQEGGTCWKAEHLIRGQCSECVECTAEAVACSD